MARGGFRGGYGGMNQANMMKQAQKIQQDFLRMQKELEEKEFTSMSCGGMVSYRFCSSTHSVTGPVNRGQFALQPGQSPLH